MEHRISILLSLLHTVSFAFQFLSVFLKQFLLIFLCFDIFTFKPHEMNLRQDVKCGSTDSCPIEPMPSAMLSIYSISKLNLKGNLNNLEEVTF